MILVHYLNSSMLFAQQINERFEQDRTIQRKLKIDFKNDLLAYVQWVNAPGNQVPLHPQRKASQKWTSQPQTACGFRATGRPPPKPSFSAITTPTRTCSQEVICRQF